MLRHCPMPSSLSLPLRTLALSVATPFACASVLIAQEPNPVPPTLVPANLFVAPGGLEVTVWATAPMLRNPTNIDFDQDGRLWVAERVNYRSQGGRQKEGDRIVVLEDNDGDGKADK